MTLLLNYIQVALPDGDRVLPPSLVLLTWLFGAWLPSLGWSLSCLYLARNARRLSFARTPPRARSRSGGGVVVSAPRDRHREYVQLLLASSEEEDEVRVGLGFHGGEEEEGKEGLEQAGGMSIEDLIEDTFGEPEPEAEGKEKGGGFGELPLGMGDRGVVEQKEG